MAILTLSLNNLKTRTDMNAWMSVFVTGIEAIICYYIICMTVPLIHTKQSNELNLHIHQDLLHMPHPLYI